MMVVVVRLSGYTMVNVVAMVVVLRKISFITFIRFTYG